MSHRNAKQQLAAALGRVPSGLFILTVRRDALETGMLTSWVQQCAFDPPHISVAIRRDRDVADWLSADSAFALNVLDDSQTDMIVHFGRGFAPAEPAFDGIDVERPAGGGAPLLTEALAYLDCRVAGRCQAGDHDLFLGRVVGGRLLNEGHPMIHVRKSGFHY
jgi:flavin reductase (DIM6/NTAB) family NADH-FMN oxidoreductase RutF